MHHWHPAIPALLAAVLFLAPRIGIMTWTEFEREAAWSSFFVIGTSLSLAQAVLTSGAASWCAKQLGQIFLWLAYYPSANIVLIILVGSLVHAGIPNIAASISLMIPVMLMLGTGTQISAIVDMWGPGAVVTPFASTINVVLISQLIDSVSELEAHAAIQSAEFRVANRLAETTRGRIPENVEVFELSKVDHSLPRVVYICCVGTMLHQPHSSVALYGLPIQESLPTLIHPNEILDGALTVDARQGGATRTTTWGWMNQPVVFRLLREHGKRVNFLGVALQRTRFETELGKQVTAAVTSQMARLLGADGAVITRMLSSGNNFMDVMLTLQACERKGVRTVLITPEWGGTEGTDLPLAFYVPEATAMVTTGSLERPIKLPVPAKVIGAKEGQPVLIVPGDPPFSPWSELTRDGWRDIFGGIDWWGGMNLTCLMY